MNGDVEPHGLGRAKALPRQKPPAHHRAQGFLVEAVVTAAGFDLTLLGRAIGGHEHANHHLSLFVEATAHARVRGLGVV